MTPAAEFTVWAPTAHQVEVAVAVAGARHPMTPAGRPGWWQVDLPVPPDGADC